MNHLESLQVLHNQLVQVNKFNSLKLPAEYHRFNVYNPGFIGSLGPPPFSDDTGLKAYWKFITASGDIPNVSQATADLGSAADLQMANLTYQDPGIPANNNSGGFNGTSSDGQSGTSVSQFNFLHTPNAKWTINFWLKYGGDTVPNNLFDTNSAGSTGRVGTLIDVNANESMKLTIFNGTGGQTIINFDSSASFVPSDDQFHFYCLRWDHTLGSSNLKLSIDDGTPETGNKTAFTPSSADAAYPLNIGQYANNAGAFLAGNLTEITIFENVLSDALVTELHNDDKGLAIY